jgi:LysR family transcriptional regulator of gallate degradation
MAQFSVAPSGGCQLQLGHGYKKLLTTGPPGASTLGSLIPNLRHLHVLSEVARHGSVSAAARRVHLSQPAVTQAVAALERELGTALFQRSAQGVAPTPAGALCIARVDRAIGQLRDGIADASRSPAAGSDPLRAITTAQLEALVAVVEQGAFGRAARASGVARTTVHRAARQLERAIGARLFESTSHGVRPTREAERLARRARLAAAELAQARAEIASLAGIDRGVTVIGAMPLARSVIVPAAVLAFAVLRPRHQISILDGPYESMLDALRRARADVLVGALREAPPEDVRQEHLFDDPLAIIVRTGHPLARGRARARRLSADALASFPWIAPRKGSPLRRHFDRLFADAIRAPLAVPVECNSLVAARGLLLASDRMMLLSASQVHHEIQAGQLVALPHPAGRVVRGIGLTVRADWRPTPVQEELLQALRDAGGALKIAPKRRAAAPSARVSAGARGRR